MSRLREKYRREVRPALQERFKYRNPMMVPTLEKVVISMGVAEATKDRNVIQDCVRELSLISGQRPIVTKAKQAIANFKLRKGQAIGVKVTLRGRRMFDFLDRMLNIAAPRIRDFRGFTGKPNGRVFTVGLSSQDIFAEVILDEMKRTQGMDVTIVTTAKSGEETVELLRLLGMPFRKSGQ
jgi:large subunit ribosomal protein L5